MNLIKKLWLWRFELKLSKVKDNEKIEFLAKELLKELEAQGYSIEGVSGCGYFNVWIHGDELYINRSHGVNSDFSIKCGKYRFKKTEVAE